MHSIKNFLLKIFAWILFSIIFNPLCNAQVLNIEKERLDEDTLRSIKIKLVADVEIYDRSITENNPNKVTDIDLDLNVLYEPGKHAYIFVTEFDYDKTNGVGVLDFGYAHARVNWLKDRKLSYENYLQFSYDKSRGLNQRIVTGFNLRFEILHDKKYELYIGSGLMYETEEWRHPTQDFTKTTHVLKNSNFISYQFRINKTLDLNNVLYFQSGLYEDQLVHRISNWLILNTKLTKYLSLKSSLEFSYEDKPIVPITNFIYTLKTGLALNL